MDTIAFKEYWSTLDEKVSSILKYNDTLGYKYIDGNIIYEGCKYQQDFIDKLSAAVALNIQKKRDQIIIIYPNNDPLRISMLFSSLAVIDWIIYSNNSKRNPTFLYFGPISLLRNYLNKSSIKFGRKKISFSNLVPQAKCDSLNNDIIWEAYIPKIFSTYLPIDPISIVQKTNPDLIIINGLNMFGKVNWLIPTLKYSKENSVPIVVLSDNPFSQIAQDCLNQGCKSFFWPCNNRFEGTSSTEGDSSKRHEYFREATSINIKPIVIDSPYIQDIFKVHNNLLAAKNLTCNRIEEDALKIGWSYLRALESLHIPLNMYDIESKNYWGIRSINSFEEAFSKFVKLINELGFKTGIYFDGAREYLNKIHRDLKISDPPLWLALAELCNNKGECDRFKGIIFPSKSRKDLFSLAILARYNIGRDKMSDDNFLLLDINEFEGLQSPISNYSKSTPHQKPFEKIQIPKDIYPILIGFPSYYITPKLNDVFKFSKDIHIMIYSYQLNTLRKYIFEWNKRFNLYFHNTMSLILSYEMDSEINYPFDERPYLLLDNEFNIPVKKSNHKPSIPSPLFETINPIEEVSMMLDDDINDEKDGLTCIAATNIGNDNKPEDIEKIVLEKVIEIHFEANWRAIFPQNETLKVINNNKGEIVIEDRYIDSLRIGDQILFIHGIKRQNLYDLIISRIHKHPAMEIHLALINRWHDDLIDSVLRERRLYKMTLPELLEDMQLRGSSIQSANTIQQWLNRNILCPEDPEDLRRIALSLGMPFVSQYYRRIYKSADRLRAIHRALAKKLNKWILQYSKGLLEKDDYIYELIDQELGLTFEDFKDSLMILRITSIEAKQGLFYQEELSKLEEGDQY